jgi:hypothetical protein
MAGFAAFMTFLIWGFVVFVIAIVLSVVLYRSAKRACPESTAAARTFRIASTLAPFLGLLWLIIALILYVKISNKVAHQSVGFSPDPYVTLPNGYVLGSMNTYDGYIRAPQAHTNVPWVGPGYVRSLIDIDLKDGRFEGTYLDSRSDMQPNGTDAIRRFVFDTKNQSIQTFATGDKADFEDQQNLVHQDENSYWVMYARYRRTWPNLIFWAILLSGEISIAAALWPMRRRCILQTLIGAVGPHS